jgi:hypothetical protein
VGGEDASQLGRRRSCHEKHHAISANSHRDTQACVDSISAQLPLPEKDTSARVVGAWAQALEDMIETFVVHEFYCGD